MLIAPSGHPKSLPRQSIRGGMPTCLLCAIAATTAVSAQLSVPPILDGQFDRGSATGMRSVLALAASPEDVRPGLNIDEIRDKTVHVTRKGKGVLQDYNDTSTQMRLTTKIWRGYQVIGEVGTTTSEGLENESTVLSLSGRTNASGLRVLFSPTRRTTLYAGYRNEEFDANGMTNIYANTFQIFSQTPPYSVTKSTNVMQGGIVQSLGDTVKVEANFGHEQSPGSITLTSQTDSTWLSLPLNEVGDTEVFALQVAPPNVTKGPRNWQATIVGGSGQYVSEGGVNRDTGQIGSATQTRNESSIAAGLQLHGGEKRSQFLYYQREWQDWQTLGLVSSPAELGTNLGELTAIAYSAGYHISTETGGIRWTQQADSVHRFQTNLSYVHFLGNYLATYDAGWYFFVKHGQTNLSPSDERLILLNVSYRYPVGKLDMEILASQGAPLPKPSHSSPSTTSSATSTTTTTTTQPPRVASGGWSLEVVMHLPFR
ncbi:MAG: hypothetical protein P4L33_16420 [Capsulimonadaceae bacterium]|nr:hypothetical protein [Capsulimonadaceae bacterium]